MFRIRNDQEHELDPNKKNQKKSPTLKTKKDATKTVI